MEMVMKVIAIWIFSYLVFKANPLNDPTNPNSKMNQYHYENLREKRELEAVLWKEEDGIRLLLWSDVWPYLQTTIVAGLVSIILWVGTK